MTRPKLPGLRLSAGQRRALIGILTALSSQLYLSVWANGFRVSASAIVYPVLLIVLMQDSRRPGTGLVTGLWVIGLRTAVDLTRGAGLAAALLLEYPGGVFYLCYDALLCLLVENRRSVSPLRLGTCFWLCDFFSNSLDLLLSRPVSLSGLPGMLATLAGLALLRSLAASAVLWIVRSYRQLLLREAHEQRYRQLFLMTANLKTELYFLKKDAADIESIMSHAYQLYERLVADQSLAEHAALALSIARDVHEVKKDNLRIIRGLESEVSVTCDDESMSLSDLLYILEMSTNPLLGAQWAGIRLECRQSTDLSVREHYLLLSILKNLVTNAVEAIQSGKGQGTIRVDCQTQGGSLLLQVSDDGPGISPRSMALLFQVGYSTKFNPDTGDINRGVGLAAVHSLVTELGGTIQVQSEPDRCTQFQLALPLAAVTGGIHENLHH